MLLEIVIVVTMLKYIQFVLARLGGAEQLVTRCNQDDVRLPLGEHSAMLHLVSPQPTQLNL